MTPKSPYNKKITENVVKAFKLHEKKRKAYLLAEKIGVSPSCLSQWKTGKRTPDRDSLLKIAEALNIPIENLYPTKESE